jgi:hypothetical protein
MQETKEQMALGQAVHKKYMKQIEMWGIIVVSIIFFLLLLKTFGVLSIIGELLSLPFKGLFSKNGGTTKGKAKKT